MHVELIVPLGAACSCAKTIQRCHLRYFSFPFDWTIGASLIDRVNIIVNDFEGWFNKEDLIYLPNQELDNDWYMNCKTGISYFHDFIKGAPLNDSYMDVNEKYERRIKRLFCQLSAAKNVLMVWITPPISQYVPTEISEATSAYRLLLKKFPKTNLSLYVFNYAKGVKDPEINEVVSGLKIISFDYRDYDESSHPYYIQFEKISPFFKGVHLQDKRLFLDKILYRYKKLRTRYRNQCVKYKANTFFGYLSAHIQYRLYYHCKKALKRRGIAIK